MKNFRIQLGVLLAALTLSVAVSAQVTSGELTGTVYDATGAVISNAEVKAQNVATGIEKTVQSNSSGVYQIRDLLIGTYDLTTSASGFTKAQSRGVAVSLNATLTVNFTLQIGSAATTVEVNTASVAIDTSTAQIQNTFNSASATQLPQASFGAGVLNLSLLSAGVASSGGIGYGSGPSVEGRSRRTTISRLKALTTMIKA